MSQITEQTDLSLLDPELRPGYEGFPRASKDNLETILKVRRNLASLPLPPVPEDMNLTEIDEPGFVGIKVELKKVAEEGGESPAVLYFHGGGMMLGTPMEHVGIAYLLVRGSGLTFYLPRYRLAPENPFPAAFDDARASFEWIRTQPSVDPARLIVGGVSGGTTLAMQVALYNRDHENHPIAGLYLDLPFADGATLPGEKTCVYDKIWDDASKDACVRLITPGSSADEDYAWPLRVKDVSGLPPTYMHIAQHDTIALTGMRMAERFLQSNSMLLELHIYPGTFHGSGCWFPDAEISKKELGTMFDWLKRVSKVGGMWA